MGSEQSTSGSSLNCSKQSLREDDRGPATLYFDANARAQGEGGGDEEGYFIHDRDLKGRMKELANLEEPIIKIQIWSSDLVPILSAEVGVGFKSPSLKSPLRHVFIVMETNEWWWSIERMVEGITIQRSKDPRFVAQVYRRKVRPNPKCEQTDDGSQTMGEMVDFLWKKDLLVEDYRLFGCNCKDFAKAVYDKVAKEKKYNFNL